MKGMWLKLRWKKQVFLFFLRTFWCKRFGHRWRYSFIDGPMTHFRVCDRCHRLESYITRNPFKGVPYWTYTVEYTKEGAKHLCPGYGKE